MQRDAEEDYGAETFCDERGEEGVKLVDAPAFLAGEGLDLDLWVGARISTERVLARETSGSEGSGEVEGWDAPPRPARP